MQQSQRSIRFVAAICLWLLALTQTRSANVVWTNLAGGNWNTAVNWSPNQVPGAIDTAWITNAGSYTVTNSATLAVTALRLGATNGTQTLRLAAGTFAATNTAVSSNGTIALVGGSFTAAGAFDSAGVINQNSGTWRLLGSATVREYNLTNGELRGGTLTVTNFNWIDGNLNADVAGDKTIIPPGGVLNFIGPNDRALSYYAGQGRGLDNYGTWNWLGSGDLRGNLRATVNNYGSVIVSTADANIQFNYGGSGGVAPIWNNFGTFSRTAGNTIFYFNNVYLNNAGSMDVQTGTLSIYNATATNLAGGSIRVAAGALLLNESSADLTLLGGSSLSAADANSVRLITGTMTLRTTNVATPSLWIQGGVLYQQTNIVVAQINQSAGVLQLGTPCFLANYNLTNGELRGRDLTVTNFNWWDGNLNSAAPGESAPPQPDRTIIPPGGVLNILGTADRVLSYYAGRGRGLDNHGTINWSAPVQWRGQNGATVNNFGEVIITAGAPNVQFDWGGSGAAPIWNNFGTLRRTAGSTLLYFDSVYLNNFGLIDIQTGTLSLYASTVTNKAGGVIQLAPGTLLVNDASGDTRLDDGSAVTSSDYNSVRLITGTLTVATTNIVTPSVWIQGGILYQQTNIVVAEVNQSAGVLQLQVPAALATYNLTNGELRGRDLKVTIFNWYDGNLNSAAPGEGAPAQPDRTIISGDGIVNFLGTAPRYLSYYAGRGRTFENNGTFNWLGGAILYGQGGATFNNYGVVNVTAGPNAQFAHGGTGAAAVWNNLGLFTKSTGTNRFSFNSVFLNNSNWFAVDAGTLSYNASTVTNWPGSIQQFSAGALLINEASSDTTFEPGAILTMSSPNAFRINSGNVYWRSIDVTLPSLWLAGGTLWQETNNVVPEINQSGGVWRPTRAVTATTYNMTNGELRGANLSVDRFNWLGGALNADGPGSNLVTVANELNIAGVTAKSMSYWTPPGRSLIHNGSGTWGGATINGQSGATIRNNGSLTMTNGSGFAWGGTGARAVFDNAGTFVRTGAVGTAMFTTVSNSGTFAVTVGALALESLTQTAGSAQLGTNFSASGNLRNDAGTLTGRGAVAGWIYNNGTFNPGASPGLVTAAAVTNTATATLNVELGGTAAGTNYDQVRLTGGANLGGDLRVLLANNFAPQLSNRFTILTHASRAGTFANVVPPPGVILNTIYSTTNVVLEVTGLTNAPLEITQFPSNQTVWTPDPVTFMVGVSGVTPITFQWQFDGVNILDATNSSYSIVSTDVTNAGTYRVLITDGNGGTTNASATLTVFQSTGAINWTNVLGGNWSAPANWSPNRVPGPTNTAVITIDGTYTVTINSAQAASNVILGATNATGRPTLNLASGGTLTLGENAAFETNAIFRLDGLLETRGGTNDVRGRIEWYSGTLSGSGHTIVRSNANIYFISGLVRKNVTSNIIENYGEFAYSPDGGYGSGDLLRFSGGAHLTNHVGGVINMKDNALQYAGTQTPRSWFVNYGTVRTTSPGVFSPSYISIDFINHGLLDNYGYVYINRGTNFGTMRCNNGLAEISIFGDPDANEYFSFEPGTTLLAPIQLAAGGPVQWRATNSVHPGGFFIGAGSGGATFPNAELKLLAPYTNTSSVVVNRGGFTIADPNLVADLRSLSDGVFNDFHSFVISNAGTIRLDNVSHTIRNFANGGTVFVRSNASFAGGAIYGGGRWVLAEGSTFSGSSFTAQRIDNFGAAYVEGGTSFGGNSVFTNHAGATLHFAGSFSGSAASLINYGEIFGYGGASFPTTNFALVEVDDSLGRTLSMSRYAQLAGETRLRRGVLGGAINILGGEINGTNRITGSLFNAAAFNAGTPFGLLTISGDYTNTASGVEQMQLRANTAVPGRDYTQVRVGGTAVLAGTLNVTFAPGFFPSIGSSFTAMTWTARSSVFDQILTPDYDFDIQYYPNALVLRASNALPSVVVSAPATQLVCVPFLLSASAADLDGVVTNLDLLFGTNVIGSFPSSAGSVRVLFDFPQTVTFSARATDDRGGVKTVATNVVYVTMPLHVINLGGFATNKNEFKLCMLGETGSNYVVEAAEMFSVPTVTNWHDIGTMSFSNGIFRFFDTNAPDFQMRYYRARQAP